MYAGSKLQDSSPAHTELWDVQTW